MRKLVATLLTALIVCPALARADTLISGDIEHGGFGGPIFRITSLNGQTVALSGGRGAWLVNSMFSIGGAGLSTASDNIEAPITHYTQEVFMEMYYG